ncbi:MAG: MMPL family transporter, partial [Balneolaceae bacterium]|nr:MMPL family transporter [Balneolaceae bacterium]
MNRFFDSLRPFIRGVVNRAWLVMFIALLFALAGGYYASFLKIDTDFSKLIPEDYPSYQALERVRNTVGGEGSDLAVGIVSPSFEANKAFAEDLIPKAMKLKGEGYERPYLRTVEYKRDTQFMEENALYFATDRELNKIEDYLQEEIEQAKLEANPFYTDFGESEDESANESGVTIGELDSVYQQLVGKEYPISDDSTTLTLRFFPEGSQTNINFINNLYDDFEELLATMEPSMYHPEMEITLAGRLMRRSIQVEAIRGDVAKTFGVGASAVILLVIFYFLYKSYNARAGSRFSWKILIAELARMPVLALVITIPLLMSLAWTFGMAYLLVGNLNIMTSTLALLLFGLGVDFGVHFYGRYSEERGMDKSILDAAETSFLSTGQAVAVGALTTSTALLVLTFADFKGFSEFGLIAGIGILFAVVAMIVVMPALLAIFERYGLLNLSKAGGFEDRAPVASKRMPASKSILMISVLAVVGSLVMLPTVSFEYDFSKLEPKYPEYEAKDEIVDRVSSSRMGSNPAYIVVDTPEEAVKVAEAVREKARKDTVSPTIKEVQTLQERFPLQEEEKQQRLEDIAEIRELLNSQYLRNENSDELARLRRAAQTREPISPEQVPDYLKDAFTTQTGEIGKFVMIYPS